MGIGLNLIVMFSLNYRDLLAFKVFMPTIDFPVTILKWNAWCSTLRARGVSESCCGPPPPGMRGPKI